MAEGGMESSPAVCCVSVRSSLLFLLLCPSVLSQQDVRPNFLLFMVDDLGYGDVGCFGNDTIRTPNIDRIASEGAKLTHHLAAASMCTPSRAAFLTGRYPVRSGMAAHHGIRYLPNIASTGGLPPNETTFATLLKQAGYATALIGKWHLGLHCASTGGLCHHPNNHGFDYFYGTPITNFRECGEDGESIYYMSHLYAIYKQICWAYLAGAASLLLMKFLGKIHVRWLPLLTLVTLCTLVIAFPKVFLVQLRPWNCLLMENEKVAEQPYSLRDLTPNLVNKSLKFIDENAGRPFFLFHSFLKVHTALFATKEFEGRSLHGRYGDNIEEMDWAVGRILDALDQKGLSHKTFVYLTSDNGGHVEEISVKDGQREGGHNGILRGGKGMAGWDGGIRMPTVLRWPKDIRPGTVVDEPTSQMDVFPTVLRLAQLNTPADRVIDGRDLMPLLTGTKNLTDHRFLIHYCGSRIHAARYRPPTGGSIWKAHYATPKWDPGTEGCYEIFLCQCRGDYVNHHDPPLLFDVANDPFERSPITPESEPKFAEIISTIDKGVKDHMSSVEQVENQFSLRNILWRPWLQPCCGHFPFCSCTDVA
ncbi:steryl-sulfatase-like [Branchiostoma floridae]|uniref:Steryl-sulfatase-like n=1 Tax=Branchiostoma floridae TaxID=7739 RepID=A0A9J7KM77_BRAFL|nr:steryl-sulfatase-like [Branchiostoma floridae]XP_035666554.1 steryl-sulfatase-like [Branchiostoma floridae]